MTCRQNCKTENYAGETNKPHRNADGSINLSHYKELAREERATTIQNLSNIISSWFGFQR